MAFDRHARLAPRRKHLADLKVESKPGRQSKVLNVGVQNSAQAGADMDEWEGEKRCRVDVDADSSARISGEPDSHRIRDEAEPQDGRCPA